MVLGPVIRVEIVSLARLVAPGVGVVVLLVVVSGAAVGAVGSVAADTHVDNETVHVHPDEIEDDSDLLAVGDWLAGRMGEIHINCAEGVRVGNFDVCDRLDDEYPEHLERYFAVEREIEGETATADTFEETRDTQDEFVDETREFWEAYEEYRDARAAGDDERAYRSARDAIRSADQVQDSGNDLTGLFGELDQDTDLDFTEAIHGTEGILEEVEETSATVETEFIATNLTVERNATDASFREPVALSGELIDENGTAVENGRVVVVVGDRRVATTRTDENGSYEVTYRPTVTSAGATSVTVQHEPATLSPYLGSQATTTVDVQVVEPEVTITETTETAAYNESAGVAGWVGVDDVGAEGVRVVVTVGDERLGVTRTDSDGTFLLAEPLPAGVPVGEQQVQVRASKPGLALSPETNETSLSVTETPTDLAVNGSHAGEELDVWGRLTAESGAPVGDQSVTINVDEGESVTATTDDDGRYRTSVDIERAESWTVTATYDDPETNLGASRAETTVDAEEEPFTIAGAVGSAANAVAAGISEAAAAIGNGFGAAVDTVVSAVDRTVTAIGDTVGSAVDAVTSAVSQIVRTVDEAVSSVGREIVTVASDPGEALSSVVGTVTGVAGSIASAVSELAIQAAERPLLAVVVGFGAIAGIVCVVVLGRALLERTELDRTDIERLRDRGRRTGDRLVSHLSQWVTTFLERVGTYIAGFRAWGRQMFDPVIVPIAGAVRWVRQWGSAVFALGRRVSAALAGLLSYAVWPLVHIGTFVVGLRQRALARWREEPSAGSGVTDDDGQPADPEIDDPASGPGPEPPQHPLEAAQQLLQAGSASRAVEVGYRTIRSNLQGDGRSSGIGSAADTYWEFYRAAKASLPDDETAALRTITEAYERAVFSSTGVERSTAEDALEAATRCLDEARPGPPPETVADGGQDEQ